MFIYGETGERLEKPYKPNAKYNIWRVNSRDYVGRYYFTFDKKTIYNYWTDYPKELTSLQVLIFKRAIPEMAYDRFTLKGSCFILAWLQDFLCGKLPKRNRIKNKGIRR